MATPNTDAGALILIALIDFLRAQEHGIDLDDLAARFGLSREQMREIINRLWSFEFVSPNGEVDPTLLFDFDAEGLEQDWVKLTHSPVRSAPRTFTANELTLVLTGLEVLREHANDAEATAIDRLRETLRGNVCGAERTPDDELRTELRRAIESGYQVHLVYSSETSVEPTGRYVDPLRLDVQGGQGYLNGYCHRRRELRWFRLDRIRNLIVLEQTIGDYTDEQISRPLRVRQRMDTVRVAIRPRVLPAVRAYLTHARIPETDAAGWLHLQLSLRAPHVAAQLAAQFAGDFVVTAPDSYRDAVARWLSEAIASRQAPTAE